MHVIGFFLFGLVCAPLALQIGQWLLAQWGLDGFDWYVKVSKYLLIMPFCLSALMCVIVFRHHFFANCGRLKINADQSGLAHYSVFFLLGVGLALLDFRPFDLPTYWQSEFGKERWVYGRVVGLPQTNERSASYTFVAKCWQNIDQKLPVIYGANHNQYSSEASKRGRQSHDCGTAAKVPSYFKRLKVSDFTEQKTSPAPGQWAWLALKLHAPRSQINPGSKDAELWYFVNRFGARAYVSATQSSVWVKHSWSIDGVRDRLSRWLGHQLREYPVSSRFAAALLLGDRRDLSPSDWLLLSRLGIGHLVAISGLHIGLAAGFGFFVARFILSKFVLPFWPRLVEMRPVSSWAWLAAFIVAIAYSALAGFTLPTLRAVMMLGLFCLWRWSFHRASLGQAWLVCAAIVLTLSPRSLLDLGFLLSFGCVGLIVLMLNQTEVLSAKWAQAVRLQAGLSVGLMPVNLVFFQQILWLSPALNFFLVPLVTCLIPILFLMMILLGLSQSLGHVFLSVIGGGIERGYQGLVWLAEQPFVFTPWTVRSPVIWLALLCLVFFWFLPKVWRLKPLLVILAMIAFFQQPEKTQVHPGGFNLTVLDVGQGLAVAIQTQHHVLVYDAGPAFAGFNQVQSTWLPFLKYHDIKKVDLLLTSHMDSDHAGSAPALLDAVLVTKQMGLEAITPLSPHSSIPPFQLCQAGQAWEWDGVVFEIVFPKARTELKKIDPRLKTLPRNLSCVLKITGEDHSILLTGDIDARMESDMLQAHQSKVSEASHPLKADILLVPHHGSLTSSSTGLLNWVAPDWAVVSHAAENAFGHPSPVVFDRYQRRGIEWLSTAECGALSFISSAASASHERPKLSIEKWRDQRLRFWRFDPEAKWAKSC